MLRPILCMFVLCTGPVYGAVKHVPIRSGVVLKPGETYTAQIESTKPVEIAWTAVQVNSCTTDCVQMTLIGSTHAPPFSAPRGAQANYTPTDGKVVVEYKNISQRPVTINVFRLERTCDAEACKLFDSSKKGAWLVFKVDEFKSITTSSDSSYSVISGIVESGRAFRIHAVWWTDDQRSAFGCPRWIKGYVDNHTPKEKYRPYILSGQNVGDDNNIILKSIDDCVPLAPHFGVPDKNVFR